MECESLIRPVQRLYLRIYTDVYRQVVVITCVIASGAKKKNVNPLCYWFLNGLEKLSQLCPVTFSADVNITVMDTVMYSDYLL